MDANLLYEIARDFGFPVITLVFVARFVMDKGWPFITEQLERQTRINEELSLTIDGLKDAMESMVHGNEVNQKLVNAVEAITSVASSMASTMNGLERKIDEIEVRSTGTSDKLIQEFKELSEAVKMMMESIGE